MAATVLRILSPADLTPGAVAPDGRTVLRGRVYGPAGGIVAVEVTFTNGTVSVYSWPSSEGWKAAGEDEVPAVVPACPHCGHPLPTMGLEEHIRTRHPWLT